MKETKRSVRLLYTCPSIEMIELDGEEAILAGSPEVRPGGGKENNSSGSGTTPSTPGVNVIDLINEDGGEDDNLVGQ